MPDLFFLPIGSFQVEDFQIERFQIAHSQTGYFHIENVQIEKFTIGHLCIGNFQIEHFQVEHFQIENVQLDNLKIPTPLNLGYYRVLTKSHKCFEIDKFLGTSWGCRILGFLGSKNVAIEQLKNAQPIKQHAEDCKQIQTMANTVNEWNMNNTLYTRIGNLILRIYKCAMYDT